MKINYFRFLIILCFFIVCLNLSGEKGASENSPISTQNTETKTKIEQTAKQPEIREILNPFYPRSVWRLWCYDETPAKINLNKENNEKEEVTIAPIPAKDRKYPFLPKNHPITIPTPLINSPLGLDSEIAGFWDDVYMSLDDGHTNLLEPAGQFIIAPKVKFSDGEEITRLRFSLGVNFTSQSYARRGRHIVDDSWNNLNTERFFYFANTIRATPAHDSFKDNDLEQVHDDYDSLYSHSYQSVGQSGSEISALKKMMLAGASLPRKTKNLLKKHGAYASALLTIFKAALPYVDAESNELPYENELRHRPAYSSSGDVGHPHFCSANTVYHGYNETLHLTRMLEIARDLEIAPPIAVLQCKNLTVLKNGVKIVENVTNDERAKSVTLTQARFWGNEGETLVLTIDLSSSYDLQGQPLRFSCQPLYPNQKNVSIRKLSDTLFEITVQHDPKLPKGRIPVIAVARNSSFLPSNPVFVNFYWNEANEQPDYFHFAPEELPDERKRKFQEDFGKFNWKIYPVTVNKRPVPNFGFKNNAIRCKPGSNITFPLKVKDPEGFPVLIYRYASEPGEIRNEIFSYQIPANTKNSVQDLHFIFSDGTRGYSGRRIRLLISQENDLLPDGYYITAIGKPSGASVAKLENNDLTFSSMPVSSEKEKKSGIFVYRKLDGDIDLCYEFPHSDAKFANEAGLMISKDLEEHWRFVLICRETNSVKTVFKKNETHWSTDTISRNSSIFKTNVNLRLRLVSRNDRVAAYTSSDSNLWELLDENKMDFNEKYAGVFYGGGGEITVSQIQNPPNIPYIQIERLKNENKIYQIKITCSAISKEDKASFHYTLDGTEPSTSSPIYSEPLTIQNNEICEFRVRAFDSEGAILSATAGISLTGQKN